MEPPGFIRYRLKADASLQSFYGHSHVDLYGEKKCKRKQFMLLKMKIYRKTAKNALKLDILQNRSYIYEHRNSECY